MCAAYRYDSVIPDVDLRFFETKKSGYIDTVLGSAPRRFVPLIFRDGKW